MSNRNFNNNDHESFMEGIYGCLERIETAVIELQKFQPNEGNSTVPNVDNTALVLEIKDLVENATGANGKYAECKIQELTKTLSENLGVVNDNVKGVSDLITLIRPFIALFFCLRFINLEISTL